MILLLVACLRPAPPAPALPYAFEPRPTTGEVRVVPVFCLHDPLPTDLGTFLGPPLPAGADARRRARTHEAGQLAEQVGRALPGEVNGALGESWAGQFRAHRLPRRWSPRVEQALRGERPLDPTLSDAAVATGGDAVLFSWMDALTVMPLTRLELEGFVVETVAGPVVVDDVDEPYLVSARIGLALVAHDGEVVIRYSDTYDAVLSGERSPAVAARDLASAVAREVVKVWATDPRLLEGEPPLLAPSRRSPAARLER